MKETTLAALRRMVFCFRGPIGKHYLSLAEAGFSGISVTIALKAANCLGLVEADGCDDELHSELNELTKKYKRYLNRKCLGMPVLLDEVCKNLDYDTSKREAQELKRKVQEGRNRFMSDYVGWQSSFRPPKAKRNENLYDSHTLLLLFLKHDKIKNKSQIYEVSQRIIESREEHGLF